MTKCCRRYKKAGYITHLSLQSSNWILLKYTTAKIVVFVSPNTFTYFSLSVFGYQNEHELSVNNNLNYVCFYFGQQELTLHYPFLLAMTSFLHFCAQNNQWIFLCFIFKQRCHFLAFFIAQWGVICFIELWAIHNSISIGKNTNTLITAERVWNAKHLSNDRHGCLHNIKRHFIS